ELQPFPVDLSPGVAQCAMEIPDGSYRIGVVPVGAVEIHPADQVLTVSGPCEHIVQVAGHDRRSELRLLDVGINELPLRVAAWRSGAIDPPDPDIIYLGPGRWTTASAIVPI